MFKSQELLFSDMNNHFATPQLAYVVAFSVVQFVALQQIVTG